MMRTLPPSQISHDPLRRGMTFPDSAVLMKSCTSWRSWSSSLLWSLFLFSRGIHQK